MTLFLSTIGSFIGAIDDGQSWVEEFNDHLKKVAALYSEASPAEISDTLHRFASLLPDLPLVALGHVAIMCGSLVECGGDPDIAGPPLLEKLTSVNQAVSDFYYRCRARAESDKELVEELRPVAVENADEDVDAASLTPADIIEDHINNEGWQDLARRFGPELFELYPNSVLAHMAEDYFRLGLIAHLSRSRKLRAMARAQSLYLQQTRTADNAADSDRSFLATMLQVLDDEQLLVLHVEQKKGFEIRISGIADNFQFQTLLAGAVIGSPSAGMLTGTAPSSLAVAQCRDAAVGDNGGEHVTGAFNLCNWGAIQADASLSNDLADSHHWIWGEGCPADILPFEGRRVVLLGRPPYGRGWGAGRPFSGMVGELTVERRLEDAEVVNWLSRLARAAHPSAPSADVGVLETSPVDAAQKSVKPWWKFL